MPRFRIGLVALLLAACDAGAPPPSQAGITVDDAPMTLSRDLVGVPVNGYPNYQERLMLVAINRARSDPNNVALQTAGACSTSSSTYYAPTAPLQLSVDGSRAARFHCQNLSLNGGGLSHNSYCTLRADIGTTNCDGADLCACEAGTECFSCTTLGGCGSSPWTRTGYFGFSANGEVGAAGYSDGWQATVGWVTECAGADGHRSILTGSNKNLIGLGYAGGGSCWRSTTATPGSPRRCPPRSCRRACTRPSFPRRRPAWRSA